MDWNWASTRGLVGVGNTGDAGLGLHALAQPASEGVLFRGGIACIGQIKLRDQCIFSFEAGRNAAGIMEAAQKQSGTDQRERSECDFDSDQHTSKPVRMRFSNSAAATFVQRLAQVCADG